MTHTNSLIIKAGCRLKYAQAVVLALFTVLGCLLTPYAYAAVQMGGHMDFVLSTGRTIRVFPEAMNMSPINPGNILPKRQKVNTRPPGGDPCKALEGEYNKRVGRREQIKKAAKTRQPVKPKWLRTTPTLRNVNFRRELFRNNKPAGWYYLPAEPRISFKDDTPEATFIKFITDETTEAGGAEGGLFHLMVTYGLTKEEESELADVLKEAVPGAQLKGMVDLEPSKNGENFIVTSGTLSDEGFAPSGVLSSGRAPSFPGAKAAIAGRLSSLGAQLMEASFENSTTDLSVTFAYDYIVKTQAYKAEVRIDMDRIQDIQDCALQTRDKTVTKYTEGLVKKVGRWLLGGKKKQNKVRISERDLQQDYETLISLGAVEIRIDQNLPDADVSIIEASLMDMAMQAFTSMQQSFATSQELQAQRSADESDVDSDGAKRRANDKSRSTDYTYYEVKRKQVRQTGVQTFKIEKGVALYRTHSMTGNIGGFIRDYKDQIYDERLLNDPFFRRGMITVDIDTEALELFEANMINNASVKVIVPFSGDPYVNGDVFTRGDIASGGIVKTFTFATRGTNQTSKNCVFKYVESWSLKGGGKWPTRAREKCAKEMAVSLVPPIQTRRIDVEADLSEMAELGIRGADVILRYKQYGKDQQDTARFRVAKGEAYVEQTIFVDKENTSVDYKIVLTHRDKGKFSTKWAALEDDFVYANLSGLPLSTLEEIRQKVPEIKEIIDEVKGLLEGTGE
ncbi:MAG: hypothetical protein ACJATK_001065 [Paracoccaceae bacterium]|jgi:hypothetical protein